MMNIDKVDAKGAVDGEVMTIFVEGLKEFDQDYYPREERLTLTHKLEDDDRKVSELTVSELKEIIKEAKADKETGVIDDMNIYQSQILMFFAEVYNDRVEFHFHADPDHTINKTAKGVKVLVNLPLISSFKEVDPLAYKLRSFMNNPKAINEGIDTLKNLSGDDIMSIFNR